VQDASEPQANAANWQFPPHNRWGFRNVRRLLPTARVRRSRTPHSFERRGQDLDGLAVGGLAGEPLTLAGVLEATFTDGFLVLHDGRIVHERYFGGLTSDTTHIVMSVSKSVVSGLIGILVERNVLALDQVAGHYLPELRHDGYGAVTLRRLLDMRSAVRYSEDYNDPAAEFFDFDAACGLRPKPRPHPARGMCDYLATLPADPTDPADFCYRSTDTDVLGWVAQRATGMALETLLATELWEPLGSADDADLIVDPLGAPLADGGLCTTLRDLARFAQMNLDRGSFNGRQILPERWVAACAQGDRAAFRRNGYTGLFPKGAYSRQWWVADTDTGRRLALGIHGQMIYLDPDRDLACVKLSSAPDPIDGSTLVLAIRACEAIAATLR
jgi:CubicO group peptidase (beta-lactamase class C family)